MFLHWQQITQHESDTPLGAHSYCTFFMLRRVHMPTQHMCTEQDKKCFFFIQPNKKHVVLCERMKLSGWTEDEKIVEKLHKN